MVIRLHSVCSGRYDCFHGMQERRSLLETFFFFLKDKGDKGIVITIPHLFIT